MPHLLGNQFGVFGAGPKAGLTGADESSNFENLFGGIGGKSFITPTFELSEGVLGRVNTEFLDESRRNLADLRANRARFGGGFTDFRRARLQDVENVRARTVGNLRSQLGRRGILGASFAGDSITRIELDFQNQKDKVAAEIDVQEFEFNLKNLAQESQIAQANLSRELTEFNIAAQFISNLNSFETRRFEAELRLEAAEINKRRSGGVRLGSSSFTFGNRGRFGSPSGGFRGSTGTTATSTSGSIVGFDDNFDISSGFTGPAKTLPSTA